MLPRGASLIGEHARSSYTTLADVTTENKERPGRRRGDPGLTSRDTDP